MISVRQLILLSAVAISFAAQESNACPELFQKVQSPYLVGQNSLCNLHDRYQKALQELEKQGIAPADRIANLHAIRMVNFPTWLKLREEKNYNPWHIYNPAPQTWQGWENGAGILDRLVQDNKALRQIQPMTYEVLKKLHAASLKGLISSAGKLRHHGEVGLSLDREHALTEEQANAMANSEYPSALKPRAKMLSWKPTQCYEDRTPEFQKHFNEQYAKTRIVNLDEWPVIDANQFFTAKDGSKKQCGYASYADPNEVQIQMDLWLGYFNAAIESWNRNGYGEDPLLLAARVQRWFITIHPYEDGNGRLSRFMMEYVLRSLGLPSPMIRDFDNDLYFTEVQWARELGHGIIMAVNVAETCAKNPTNKGCQVVSEVP